MGKLSIVLKSRLRTPTPDAKTPTLIGPRDFVIYHDGLNRIIDIHKATKDNYSYYKSPTLKLDKMQVASEVIIMEGTKLMELLYD